MGWATRGRDLMARRTAAICLALETKESRAAGKSERERERERERKRGTNEKPAFRNEGHAERSGILLLANARKRVQKVANIHLCESTTVEIHHLSKQLSCDTTTQLVPMPRAVLAAFHTRGGPPAYDKKKHPPVLFFTS